MAAQTKVDWKKKEGFEDETDKNNILRLPKNEGEKSLVVPVRPGERKEVPFGVVIFAGVLIWVLVFGTIFSYAAVSPCSFVTVVIGERKTLETLSERLSMDFTDENQCRHFLRMTVVTPGFVETG